MKSHYSLRISVQDSLSHTFIQNHHAFPSFAFRPSVFLTPYPNKDRGGNQKQTGSKVSFYIIQLRQNKVCECLMI